MRNAVDCGGEFGRIAWLRRLFSGVAAPGRVKLAIGDDAAIVEAKGGRWVWTIDACVQDVHFAWPWLTAYDLGWRSLQAAVSDSAAMGAKPVAALCSMALPAQTGAALWRGIARGQASAAEATRCPIIGGNLSGASEVSLHTTVLGYARKPLLRSGARPGDELWLIGSVGKAAAGLAVLERVPQAKRSNAMRACVRAWQRPNALVKQGVRLCSCAHAAIDVSDGVAGDARHLSDASAARVVLQASLLEQAAGKIVAEVARALEHSVLDLVLFGGEDYALLAAGPARHRPAFARCIGHVDRGRGLWLEHPDGKRVALGSGYDHFRYHRGGTL
jgi:thiamine-monophosphate kinase